MESSTNLTVGRFSGYFKHSGSAYYGVVTAIPMLLVYEALLFIGGNPQMGQIRNLGDVWLRQILGSLDIKQSHAAMVMLLGLVIAMVVLRRGGIRLKGSYLGPMAAEAAVYGLLLAIISNVIFAISSFVLEGPALQTQALAAAGALSGGVVQNIALFLGAGLFEEFIFRVVLLWGLLLVFKPWLPNYLATAAAIGIAAGLFSAAHYIGPMAYRLEFQTFLFRFIAGLWFTGVYYFRGFSLAAYSHAFYDIMIYTYPG